MYTYQDQPLVPRSYIEGSQPDPTPTPKVEWTPAMEQEFQRLSALRQERNRQFRHALTEALGPIPGHDEGAAAYVHVLARIVSDPKAVRDVLNKWTPE